VFLEHSIHFILSFMYSGCHIRQKRPKIKFIQQILVQHQYQTFLKSDSSFGVGNVKLRIMRSFTLFVQRTYKTYNWLFSSNL